MLSTLLYGFEFSSILSVLIFLAYISISYFLIRWVFSIEKNLKNQGIQISVLFKIAEKLGVTEDELDEIREYYQK